MRDISGTTTNKELRALALKCLGNRCAVPECTWFHPDAFDIDHIVPLGTGRNRNSSRFVYLTILKMTNPRQEYQILCTNHHRLKTVLDMEEYWENKNSLRQLDTQGV